MEQFDRDIRKMAHNEPYRTPEFIHSRIEETLTKLPEAKTQEKVRPFRHSWNQLAGVAACIVFLLVFVMPNVSTAYAATAEKIPGLGNLIRVVTIRNYFYHGDNHYLDMEVPGVEGGGTGGDFINKDVEEITEKLQEQFYAELNKQEDGHNAVIVGYDILHNTDRWFTMRLAVDKIQASSSTSYRFYNVDRVTGRMIELEDLFTTDDFSAVIAANIQKQMREQMAQNEDIVYWLDKEEFGDDFTAVDGKHNFYFNEAGDLVIPFDKYEVGPGSTGSPEFVVEKDAIRDILKPEYRDVTA